MTFFLTHVRKSYLYIHVHMYYRDLHGIKYIKYRFTCMILFHTYTIQFKTMFFNIHIQIIRGGDP